MVKEKSAKVYVEHLYCDKCGTEMEHTGVVINTYPAIYPYKCPKCGWEVEMSELYPKTVFKESSTAKVPNLGFEDRAEEKKLCECGGELEFEGSVMTSCPPQYPYTCKKCGKRYVYRVDGTRWEW